MSTRPFRIKKITGASPGDGVDAFKAAIRARKLIAFLGAAVSANNLNASSEYAAIIGAIDSELQVLRRSLARLDGKKQYQRFLAEFEIRYMEIRTPAGYANNDGNHSGATKLIPPGSEQMSHDDVRALRVALAQLIVALTTLFKRLHAKAAGVSPESRRSSAFFFSNRDLAVSLPNKEVQDDAKDHAKNVLDLLKKIQNLSFNIGGARTIFEGMFRELDIRYDDSTGLKTPRDGALCHLDIGHLTWLSDLLWLTFLIWLPLYPTSHELAVELSLVAESKKKTSGIDMLRTAECVKDPQELSNYLRDRFLRFVPDRKQEPSRALFMESHWRTAAVAIFQSSTGEGHDRGGNPVIFTTNFDNGLELALEQMIRENLADRTAPSNLANTYRVVFPILAAATANGSDEFYYLWWIARDWTVSGAEDEPIITYKWLDDSGNNNASADFDFPKKSSAPQKIMGDGESFVAAREYATKIYGETHQTVPGPVVVKLHGGPLHDLPPSCQIANARQGDGERRYKHYIVLAEHQYLEAIIRENSSFPIWASDLLAGSQHVSFVGYSVSDWNIRVQLAKDLSENASDQPRPESDAGSAVAIVESLIAHDEHPRAARAPADSTKLDASHKGSVARPRRSILVKSIDQPGKALLERLGVWSEEIPLADFTKRLYHGFDALRNVDPNERRRGGGK